MTLTKLLSPGVGIILLCVCLFVVGGCLETFGRERTYFFENPSAYNYSGQHRIDYILENNVRGCAKSVYKEKFTPLEIMPHCSAVGLDLRIIPAGFNAPLEFLTGFTIEMRAGLRHLKRFSKSEYPKLILLIPIVGWGITIILVLGATLYRLVIRPLIKKRKTPNSMTFLNRSTGRET